MTTAGLSTRSQLILSALVRTYIETGEPVASLVLSRRAALGLSSATVRHVLADLEDAGYVRQPHTSAGRMPTDRAYRFYVDLLLQARRPNRAANQVQAQLRRQTSGTALMDEVLSNVSHVLSRVSRHVGFALAPPNTKAVFHQIECIQLPGSKVVVVVVSRGGEVSQKVVDLGERLDPTELRQAANYLNSEFSGSPLLEVRKAVLERLRQERTLYDRLLSRALSLARSTLEDLPEGETLFVGGASSLLDAIDAAGPVNTLRALFAMVEEKQRLVRLLNEYLDGPGLTIVIGAEHTSPDLRPFSLIASTFGDGERTGMVGIIGPTRMRYSRAIEVVDGAAQALCRVLRDRN